MPFVTRWPAAAIDAAITPLRHTPQASAFRDLLLEMPSCRQPQPLDTRLFTSVYLMPFITVSRFDTGIAYAAPPLFRPFPLPISIACL